MAFGRLSPTRSHAPMSDINVTPLVDVMLVLVVIFILAAPLLASSIRLQLPQAAMSVPAAASAAAPIRVALDAAGQASVQDEALDDAALAQRLRALAAQQPQAEIALHADTRVPYGRVVQVMAAAQAAGLTRIGLLFQPAALPAP
ncbi:biopolymer transporter ExbD [Melaminivora sp.]